MFGLGLLVAFFGAARINVSSPSFGPFSLSFTVLYVSVCYSFMFLLSFLLSRDYTPLFSCGRTTLQEALSVRRSVDWSVGLSIGSSVGP